MNFANVSVFHLLHKFFFKHPGTVLFCLTDSADGAAGQTGRTVPECLKDTLRLPVKEKSPFIYERGFIQILIGAII
jgi:hypothetical protein